MKKLITLLMTGAAVVILSACGGGGGGPAAPSDEDNISEVKLTDLRLGYLLGGLILTDGDEWNVGYDLGFCNDEVTSRMIFGGWADDRYSVGTFEIVGEDTIVFEDGDFIVESGTLEEGETYIIHNNTWYLGSISKIECIVEPL